LNDCESGLLAERCPLPKGEAGAGGGTTAGARLAAGGGADAGDGVVAAATGCGGVDRAAPAPDTASTARIRPRSMPR
jgi:hypothetical protein